MAWNLQNEYHADLEEIFERSRHDWLGYQDVHDIFLLREELTLTTEPVDPFEEEGLYIRNIGDNFDTVDWDLLDDGNATYKKILPGVMPTFYTIARFLLPPVDHGVQSFLERRVYKSINYGTFLLAHYRSHHIRGELEEDTDENAESSHDSGDGSGDDGGNQGDNGQGDGAAEIDNDDDDGAANPAAWDFHLGNIPEADVPDAAPAASVTNLVMQKERKMAIKAIKSHVGEVSSDQFGSMVLACIFSIADDTKLVTKDGSRPLMQLLQPYSSRYFSHDDSTSLDLSVPPLCLMTCLKYCLQAEKEAVFNELQPHFFNLSSTIFAVHVLKKMLDGASEQQLSACISSLQGHVAPLLRHMVGSVVVEHAYDLGTAAQKQELLGELYSTDLQLFKDLNSTSERRVVDIIAKLGLQKGSVNRHMTDIVQPILEKGIVDHSIIHKLLIKQHLTIADKQLTGPLQFQEKSETSSNIWNILLYFI